MTAGYVNKDKLIEDIRRAASRSMVGEIDEPYLDWKTVVSFIFDAPVEAVEPVLQGKWSFAGDGIVACSNCEEVYDAIMLPRNYCPNCGARMRGN